MMSENFAKSIIKTVPQWVKSCEIINGELMITVYSDAIVPVCNFLKHHMGLVAHNLLILLQLIILIAKTVLLLFIMC